MLDMEKDTISFFEQFKNLSRLGTYSTAGLDLFPLPKAKAS